MPPSTTDDPNQCRFSIVFDQPLLCIVHSFCCTPYTLQFTFTLSFPIGNSLYFQSNHPTSLSKMSSCLLCHFSLHYSYCTLGLDQFDPFNSRVPNFSHLRCHCEIFSRFCSFCCILGGFQKPKPKENTTEIGKIVNFATFQRMPSPLPKKGVVGMDVDKGWHYLCHKKNRDLQFQRCSSSSFPRKPCLQSFHFFLVVLFFLLSSSLAKYHVCFSPSTPLERTLLSCLFCSIFPLLS